MIQALKSNIVEQSQAFSKYLNKKIPLVITEKNVSKLYASVLEDKDTMYYIDSIGQVSYAGNTDPTMRYMDGYTTAIEAKNLAEKRLKGRLVATFNKDDNTVKFFLNPRNDEQGKRVSALFNNQKIIPKAPSRIMQTPGVTLGSTTKIFSIPAL